ncbi:hypothetical protein CDO44_09840 [Pigmentiphaga sp. NML080357]|uniref:helix-turn-helix transcriptional regulator n=1 Tax=Pigmentiphaga sp. NML080357 TaxID=2008675 RepID=UPI000B422453|nr:LuxR C-terminal-related transcriptional regulator [Pigmentiphaga sp. NML080357]OVZ60382.1 hypothetical protein CDO44_09840 [Pigmentiphaga sp. NML080357]
MAEPLSLQRRVGAIAARLYDGIASPDQWLAGLELLRTAVDGQAFHHITVDRGTGAVVEGLAFRDAPQGKVAEYEQHYATRDERVALISRLREGSFILDHEHLDSRQMSRSAVYADFLRSVDLRHSMAALVREDASSRDYLGIMRAFDHRAYGERERALLTLVMPDMVRAGRLRSHMRQLSREALLGRTALDYLPRGVAVANAQGRVEYANARAERHLRTADWLGTKADMLCLRDVQAQPRLRTALQAACSPTRKADLFTANTVSGKVWITVVPLEPLHPLAGLRTTPLALVIFSVAGENLPLEAGLLSKALGITPTEARLAQALAAGTTVKGFAAAQGISLTTVRSHLKNLFRKTGCRRQVELVQLIRALG